MGTLENDYPSIKYPRKKFTRKILRFLGWIIIRVFFRVDISGRKNFPDQGPLIVVGNHSAIMESVLLMVFTPWEIEMLGAADIPHEKFNQIISDLYGYIPVNRGHVDRKALRESLNVLDQNGIIGIFPEGGIWEPGVMRAQTGVSWISFRGNTPVLPIGFSGSLGAIDKAIKLERPILTMKVGNLIPALKPNPSIPRKTSFEKFSENVMSQVRNLVLPDDITLQEKIKDERFELKISLHKKNGSQVDHPQNLIIWHDINLARFFHRPAILKLFRSNLKLPIDALENLDQIHNPRVISKALEHIISYLLNVNPYLLSYRFGPKIAAEMLRGMQELLELSIWAENQDLTITVSPIRRFFSIEDGEEIVQIKQNTFTHWM